MIEWVESRNSMFVPQQNGSLLCSFIDPVNEAKKWVQGLPSNLGEYDVIFVLGLAGGFHVNLLSQSFPEKEIIVIEPVKQLGRELLSRRGPLPTNVTLLLGLDIDGLKKSIFLNSGIKSLYRVVKFPASWRLNENYFRKTESLLLGHEKSALEFHLQGRTRLRDFFSNLNLTPANIHQITILDITRAIQQRADPLQREGKILMALRELVK